MKTVFAIMALTIGACLTPPGPVTLETEGALTRQVTRVVSRHDVYVASDTLLNDEQRKRYNDESREALNFVSDNPQVTADLLGIKLVPVLDRHDAYVYLDESLDELERGVYLGSTAELRSLLSRSRAIPLR
jgi:hypothetical protein